MTPHEAINRAPSTKHFFSVPSLSAIVIVHAIAQTVSRFLEVLDELVDIIFLPRTVDPAAVQSAVKAPLKPIRAVLDPLDQVLCLALVDSIQALVTIVASVVAITPLACVGCNAHSC
jgi:hypothetical protein